MGALLSGVSTRQQLLTFYINDAFFALVSEGAPTTLVSLIGHKQYRRCAKDMYYFLQVTIVITTVSHLSLLFLYYFYSHIATVFLQLPA